MTTAEHRTFTLGSVALVSPAAFEAVSVATAPTVAAALVASR